MKNILTIFRRDIGSYFTSPIGYIFIIVFLLISVGLYITSFFTFPVADMRMFFGNLPILMCVFIPAVTMRVWAEERKENTWEMLLTFPMRGRELVLGKFLTVLSFFAVTLAATFTVPLMLVWLGNPDNGALIGGYLGALLMGALFLSIGILVSGFFKDQIIAFVVALLVCFALFLLGTNFIAAYVDSVIPGLGSLLGELVGVIEHYNAFTRGVIELGDVLYFFAWTTLFLVLNTMYIDARSRPGAKAVFSGALVLCLAIGMLFNWLLTGQSLGRFDLTEDKIYTVSDASKTILSKLNVPVQVKLYITPKAEMPTGMKQLEQDVTDKLEELRVASGGNLQYTTVHMNVANVLADPNAEAGDAAEGEDEKAIEKRMLDKGVQPFSVQAMSQDQVTSKLVYSSLVVGYQAAKEEIIPQIVPQNLTELEYQLVNVIYKLTQEKAPVVALVAPKEAVTIPPHMRQLYAQMGQPVPTSEDPYVYLQQVLEVEKYQVQRIDLTETSGLPAEYDTLVVVNPRELNDRQRWEINRALVSGKSVVLAAQNYEWDYQSTRTGTSVNRREENPNVNELLASYGLGIDTDVLMDTNMVPLTIQSNQGGLLGALMGQTVNLPTHILVNNASMDQETSITSRLDSIFYLWGSALTLDDDELTKHGLDAKVIMSTSDGAWKVPSGATLTNDSFTPPASGGEAYPLMAMVSGQFPDAFQGKPRPTWPQAPPTPGQPPPPPPPAEPAAGPVTPAPGKLILLGCAEMFRKNFLRAKNLDLFLNVVDATTLGDDLINVRGRKPINRIIDRPSDGQRAFWKFVNYAFMSIVVAVAGVITMVGRRRARDAYTMQYVQGEGTE